MSTKADTEHKRYYFKASEYADGSPFIGTEPKNGELTLLKDHSLGFGLMEGISYEGAQEIAVFLNKNIKSIAITSFWEE